MTDLKSHLRSCPRCEADRPLTLPRYGDGRWRLVRCATCAFVYVPEGPDYDELVENLAWEKTAIAEKKRRAKRWPRARGRGSFSLAVRAIAPDFAPRRADA